MEMQIAKLRVEMEKMNSSLSSIARSLAAIVALAKDDPKQDSLKQGECCGKCHGGCTESEGGTPE